MMRGRQIDPGELDRKVTLSRRTTANDGRGDAVETLSALATVWARKSEMRGRERFEAGRVVALRAGAYLVRYRDDVTERMVLTDGADQYEIVGLAEVGRKDWLELSVESRAP